MLLINFSITQQDSFSVSLRNQNIFIKSGRSHKTALLAGAENTKCLQGKNSRLCSIMTRWLVTLHLAQSHCAGRASQLRQAAASEGRTGAWPARPSVSSTMH